MHKWEIKEATKNRGNICDALLRSLPLWFGIESAIKQYVMDVEQMPMFVAYENDRHIGFVSLKHHNEWTSEIQVMAVHPTFHRRSVGHQLIAKIEAYLQQQNYKFLTVKTLSPSQLNHEYEITRNFYFKMGFLPLEEFKTLWGETNPCLLMAKSL